MQFFILKNLRSAIKAQSSGYLTTTGSTLTQNSKALDMRWPISRCTCQAVSKSEFTLRVFCSLSLVVVTGPIPPVYIIDIFSDDRSILQSLQHIYFTDLLYTKAKNVLAFSLEYHYYL